MVFIFHIKNRKTFFASTYKIVFEIKTMNMKILGGLELHSKKLVQRHDIYHEDISTWHLIIFNFIKNSIVIRYKKKISQEI